MSTITLPNIRVSSDLEIRLKLKDGGVAIDWSTLTNIKASIYSDRQRSLAGRCDIAIDEEDSTILVCRYSANKPQYPGVNRVIVCCTYDGETKTYDKPAFTFVRWTDDQAGQSITIDDPDIDVEITVEDISSSILQEAVEAANSAAERANDAAAAAEHMVDIHTGPAGADGADGKSAYELAVEEGYTGTEEEWLASLHGADGTDGTDGTDGKSAYEIAVDEGFVGTEEQWLASLKGEQGNTGSSVDYPYELVNNRTTDDATKGLSAAEGKRLGDDLTQLEHQVSDMAIPGNVRQAIASVLENVAFANDDGYSSELAIIRAWADNLVLVSIDAVFTQGGNNIYATDSLDKLKQYLVVTANYDDSSSAVLGDNDYTLSGTLTVGTSTITVTYQGKTDTFTVTVSASPFLYVLPSTFTSDGDSVVDTGFMPEKNKTYTILCESTESTASSAAVFIYGNRLTHGATSYLGLTSQTSKVWGMGITYSSRISAAQNLLRTAVVMVVDGDGKPSCSISYKIGSNAIASKNNSYNFDTTDSSIVANMMLGDCTNHGDDGFLGSVTYFAIYDGEMAAADITDFLTNGAS